MPKGKSWTKLWGILRVNIRSPYACLIDSIMCTYNVYICIYIYLQCHQVPVEFNKTHVMQGSLQEHHKIPTNNTALIRNPSELIPYHSLKWHFWPVHAIDWLDDMCHFRLLKGLTDLRFVPWTNVPSGRCSQSQIYQWLIIDLGQPCLADLVGYLRGILKIGEDSKQMKVSRTASHLIGFQIHQIQWKFTMTYDMYVLLWTWYLSVHSHLSWYLYI